MTLRPLLATLALALALAACQSTPTASTPAAGATGATGAPPAGATGDATPGGGAAQPKVAAAAPPKVAAAAQPTVPPAPITFRFANRTGKPRYLTYARHWTEALKVERRAGADWKPVAYQSPICTEACPADGAAPTCRFCSPPIPVPSYRPIATEDFEWDGTVYDVPDQPGARCHCYRQVPAAAGRYRVTLCVHAEVECHHSPCRGRRDEKIGSAKDKPACTTVEFDVDGHAHAVPVAVR